MKRISSFIMSALIIFSLALSTGVCSFASETEKVGDLNADGKITVVDAKLVLKHVAGTQELDSSQLRMSDVNSDGRTTVADAKVILRVVAGIQKMPSLVVGSQGFDDDGYVEI